MVNDQPTRPSRHLSPIFILDTTCGSHVRRFSRISVGPEQCPSANFGKYTHTIRRVGDLVVDLESPDAVRTIRPDLNPALCSPAAPPADRMFAGAGQQPDRRRAAVAGPRPISRVYV